MELSCFSKTSVGYSHLKTGKVCQDFSATYHDEARTIVTACDGHGGSLYIRSHLGSKFASDAVMRVFSSLEETAFCRYSEEEIVEKLRLNILCEWNAMVERSISLSPIRKKECRPLSEKDELTLKLNAAKAYGTTLNGAMVLRDRLICASLGDGGVFLIKNGSIEPAFVESEDEETVANITYSMCQEDAYKHLKTAIFDFTQIDGVMLCTDGLINPYRNLANFEQSFVRPVIALSTEGKTDEISDFVIKLGTEIGIGDDVSLGLILKRGIDLNNYKG